MTNYNLQKTQIDDRVNRGNPEKLLKACEIWQLQICNGMWMIKSHEHPFGTLPYMKAFGFRTSLTAVPDRCASTLPIHAKVLANQAHKNNS